MHFLFLADDLHGPSSQDKTRAHEHGIANLPGSPDTLFHRGHSASLWLRDRQFFQQLLECIPVLSAVNRIAFRSNEADAAFVKGLSQIYGSLSAERGDKALRFFHCNDIHHLFDAEGFKIQLIRAAIIRGHGLRIVVDNNRLIARSLQGLDCMDSRIIKFHTLADADGAGTQNDDLLFFRCSDPFLRSTIF